MAESDDEIVAEPVENESEPIEPLLEPSPGEQPADEPTEPPVEPADEAQAEPPMPQPAEEPAVADDPIAAIQDQLELEEPDAALEPEAAVSEDELAAAIAASHEQVGTETALDDTALASVEAENTEEAEEAEGAESEGAEGESLVRYGAPWWPFLLYLIPWFALAGVAVWQFEQLPQDVIVYETEQYTMYVFGGIALAVSGVFLVLAVWLASRISPKRQRKGLFTSALIMGAVVTLVGVLAWWGAIMALDYLRLGRVI